MSVPVAPSVMPVALLNRFRAAMSAAYQAQGESQVLWRLAEMDRALGNLEQAAGEYARYAELHPEKRNVMPLSRLMAGTATGPAEVEEGVVPFVLVKDLAPEGKLVEIRRALEERRQRFAEARVRNEDGEYVDVNFRIALYVKADADFRELTQEWFRAAIARENMAERLAIEPVLGGKEEIGSIAYASGGKYAMHRDLDTKTDNGRRLTAVWFVHDVPKGFSGGDLLLHDEPPAGQGFTRIVPERNMAIFFPSRCLHEVTPVESSVEDVLCGRVVVNGWFHRG